MILTIKSDIFYTKEHDMMRYDIINRLIKTKGLESYLEIGLDQGVTFNQVNAKKKVSVDPAKTSRATPTHLMTSNEFFEQNEDTFDIVFIDGLHHADQVYQDIMNSLSVLNPGGVVVCHDMGPKKEIHQIVPRQQTAWTGDCWKALVRFRLEHLQYSVVTVDTDWGVAIIEEADSLDDLIVQDDLSFENFLLNKREWTNLISVKEFNELYK